MRVSRRIALGSLVLALGAGAWWMSRRADEGASPSGDGAVDEGGRTPQALGVPDASRPAGERLAGAAPEAADALADDPTAFVVLVVGPDGPIRGAEVRLSRYSTRRGRYTASDGLGEHPEDLDAASDDREERSSVQATERPGTSDARGRCRFTKPEFARGTVSASAPGFVRGVQWFDLRRSPIGEVRVELARAVVVEGYVVEAGTGAPIAGAEVGVGPDEGMEWPRARRERRGATAITDAGGRFALSVREDTETVQVYASAADHVAGFVEVRGWRGHFDPESPSLRLPRVGAITGVVRGPDGRPLASATVSISEVDSATPAADASSLGSVDDGTGGRVAPPTGVDGTFRFAGLARGAHYRLRALVDGYPSVDRDVPLGLGEPTESVDVRFAEPATVAVRVLGPDERPIAYSVTITVTAAGTSQRRLGWSSDGRHVFDRVAPGSVRVTVATPSGAEDERTVAAQAGAVTEVTFRPAPGGDLRGTVVDGEGRRLVEATVFIDGRSTTMEADGSFTLANVARREHWIGATAVGDDGRTFATLGHVTASAPAAGVRVVVHRLARVRLRVAGIDVRDRFDRIYAFVGRVGSHPVGGRESWTAARPADGAYEVDAGVAEGDYDLYVCSSAFAPIRRSLKIRLGEDVDLGEVRVEAGVAMHGRVLDARGAPVVGADVTLTDSWSTTETGPDGSFDLAHVGPGPVSVDVALRGGPSTRATVDASEGGAPCEIRMPESGLVRGAVRGADGRPRSGVVIRFVRSDDASATEVDAPTSRLGRVFAVLPAGTWNATYASAHGRRSVLDRLNVVAGGVADVELRLPND